MGHSVCQWLARKKRATSTTSLSAQPRQDRRTKRRAFTALDGPGRKTAAGSISPADAKVCVPTLVVISIFPSIAAFVPGRSGARRWTGYGQNEFSK